MLPLFQIIYDELVSPETLKMSLVTSPAVESLFLKFKNAEPAQKFMFSVEDEDQHTIYGVALRADFPIYRNEEDLGEFYIQFDKDTIKLIESEFLKTQQFNLQHQTDTEAIQVLESFIIDRENGISPSQFLDIEDGSWILKCKVNDDEIWRSIKNGEFAGFSIEAVFSLDEIKLKAHEILAATEPEHIHKPNPHMMNIKSIRTKLAKLLLKLGTANATKDGIEVVFEFDGPELKDGVEVFITDENEELIHPEDGVWTIDNQEWEVRDGVVKLVNAEPVEEPEEEPEQENLEEEPAEPEQPSEPAQDLRQAIDELTARFNDMASILNELINNQQTMGDKLNELELQLKSLVTKTPEKLEKQTVKTPQDNPYACLSKK